MYVLMISEFQDDIFYEYDVEGKQLNDHKFKGWIYSFYTGCVWNSNYILLSDTKGIQIFALENMNIKSTIDNDTFSTLSNISLINTNTFLNVKNNKYLIFNINKNFEIKILKEYNNKILPLNYSKFCNINIGNELIILYGGKNLMNGDIFIYQVSLDIWYKSNFQLETELYNSNIIIDKNNIHIIGESNTKNYHLIYNLENTLNKIIPKNILQESKNNIINQKNISNAYVIIIGIHDYKKSTLNSLPAVKLDVKKMKDLFSNQYKYKHINILFIIYLASNIFYYFEDAIKDE